MKFYLPIFTLFLGIIVLCVSSYVAYEVHGSIFSKVRILELREYGGVTFEQLGQLELWRLVSSQLVHVKPIHMLFNVLSLLFIGYFVEKIIGGKKLLLLFFIAGIIGTLASILPVEAPYDVGTGTSQAVFGLVACGVLLMVKGLNKSVGLKLALLFCIIPAMALDIIYVGYPKIGHLVSFATGLVISLYYLSKPNISQYQKLNN